MNLCKVGTIYLYLKARMADVVSDSSRTKRKTNKVQQQQMDEPNFVHHSADGSNIIVKAAADRTPQRNCSGEWRQFDFDRHKTWKWMSQYEWRKANSMLLDDAEPHRRPVESSTTEEKDVLCVVGCDRYRLFMGCFSTGMEINIYIYIYRYNGLFIRMRYTRYGCAQPV